jgi:hypothetical protein
MGIAGDVFIKTLLDDCSETEKSHRIAKFVKFISMIRLLRMTLLRNRADSRF